MDSTITHRWTCPDCGEKGFSTNHAPKDCPICLIDFNRVPVIFEEIDSIKPPEPTVVLPPPDSPKFDEPLDLVVIDSLLVGIEGTEIVLKVQDKEERLEGQIRLTPEESKTMAKMLISKADAIIANRQRNRRR